MRSFIGRQNVTGQLKLALLSGAAFALHGVSSAQDVSYEYDALGRVTAVKYSGSDAAVQTRLLSPEGQFPYGGSVHIVDEVNGLELQATQYDEGGQGVAYNDNPGRDGGHLDFRPESDVETGGDEVSGVIVWGYPGEWVEFTIDVEEAGDYHLLLEMATAYTGNRSMSATFAQNDTVYENGSVSYAGTGGWGNYVDIGPNIVSLAAGVQVMRVHFDTGGQVFSAVKLNPVPPNDPPTISGSLPTKTYDTGVSVNIPTAQVFSDPEGQALTYIASSLPTGLFINAQTGVITGSTNVVGTNTVTVTALDPAGASAAASFSLVINQANRAPVLSTALPNRTVYIGQVSTLNLNSYFSDPDGDALSYSISGSHHGVSITGTTLRMQPTTLVSPRNVTITASDGQYTRSDTYSYSVPNRSPQVVGSVPTQTFDTGVAVNIGTSGMFSDPDGHSLTYSASNLPAGLSINAGNGVITGSTSVPGSTLIVVAVNDGNGGTASTGFNMVVNQANRAPVLSPSIPDQYVIQYEQAIVYLNNYFSDPDGDTLTYSVSGGGSYAYISGNTLRIQTNEDYTQPLNLTVAASDGSLTRSDTVYVEFETPFGGGGPF